MARRPPRGPSTGRGAVVPPARGAQPSRAQGQLLGVIVAGVFAAVAIVVGGIALTGGSGSSTVATDGADVPSISATEGTPSEAPTEATTPEPSAAPSDAASPEPVEPTPATEPAPSSAAPTPSSAAPSASQSSAPAPTASAAPSTPAPATPATGSTGGDGTTTAAAPPTTSIFQGLAVGVATEDVSTWQARMVERGWDLEVDGIYGPRTQAVATAFQAEKGLAVDGIVGPNTWDAAWSAPIT